MDFVLTPAEARILGALLEKDITTPEYYPLTLNALVNACNQKSNRDPVVAYDETSVSLALDEAKHKGFVIAISGGSNRVPKYGHRIGERLNLGRREVAILCELMLRGPQTPGELRSHAARLYEFEDLDEIEIVLRGLMERQPDPLVAQLARQPGSREVRFAHLLSGQPLPEVPGDAPVSFVSPLEAEVRALREEVDRLKGEFAQFRRQFE